MAKMNFKKEKSDGRIYSEKVENPTHKFIVQAIRSYALTFPSKFDAEFCAEGVSPERCDDASTYIFECEKRKIIPYSKCFLRYDDNRKIFVPVNTMIYDSNQILNRICLVNLLNGSRINQIRVEGSIDASKEFVKKEGLVDMLLEQNYKILEARFGDRNSNRLDGTFETYSSRVSIASYYPSDKECTERRKWFHELCKEFGIAIK